MARKKSPTKNAPTPVASIRHKDTRKNIPTEELRDFVADEENAPKTMLYPRDPSLDPQLVWKGKDEQDQADLAVPIVPIYIQEARPACDNRSPRRRTKRTRRQRSRQRARSGYLRSTTAVGSGGGRLWRWRIRGMRRLW